MAPKKNGADAGLAALKHYDKRVNIPTEELRDFVAEDESCPRVVRYPGQLYARDPSLDPQLVWKGKDEQDRSELEVPCVPIYIQEKIQPRALIENLRRTAKNAKPPAQPSLFSDFNGIEFEELVEFYRHAYFTGAEEPYEKLKRALRAEVDEAAWSTLYATRSRPFEPPSTGKIAVKVINHYGDEVLKVYGVAPPDRMP